MVKQKIKNRDRPSLKLRSDGKFEFEKWLKTVKPSTRGIYRSRFKVFEDYSELDAKELIDEIEEDMQKSPRDQGVPEERLINFNFLL